MDDEDADAIGRRLGRLHGTLTDPAWGTSPFAQEVVHTVGDARRLLAEVRRLRDAVRTYGRHLEDCVFWQDDEGDVAAYAPNGLCSCGFDELLLPH
jgi:predicted trehalose synthase